MGGNKGGGNCKSLFFYIFCAMFNFHFLHCLLFFCIFLGGGDIFPPCFFPLLFCIFVGF